MRPLLVLILVIAALGVFFAAMNLGSDVQDPTGITNDPAVVSSGTATTSGEAADRVDVTPDRTT